MFALPWRPWWCRPRRCAAGLRAFRFVIDPGFVGMRQLGRSGLGGEGFEHCIMSQPGANDTLHAGVALGEKPTDPVARLGELEKEIQIEAGGHD